MGEDKEDKEDIVPYKLTREAIVLDVKVQDIMVELY